MRFVFSFCLVVFLYGSSFAQQLVLPGDHPDPSVVKIGDTYWASATTSNWAPVYPLLQSKDLVNWKNRGFVFPQLPDWADYYFWAPEITYENGKIYLYYSAHKRGGNLCVGVASADKPEGPYKDHGPLICQEAGSIDAFPMRDENGKLFLIWKEDGNSVGKPTPIWAQELNEERTALIGEKKELFRNTLPWEGNLVEGVSMIRHNGYFYAFYAAAGCCGRGCNYVTGVARSRQLAGPWEKRNQPLLADNETWKCPGHGTPVERDGKFYFLYHAYNQSSNVYTGRQGLLSEFRFTPDGWIEWVPQQTPALVSVDSALEDRFKTKELANNWQWSVFQKPIYTIKRNALQLRALPAPSGAFIGQKTYSAAYDASVQIKLKKSSAGAGIAAIGDDNNMIRAVLQNDSIKIVQLKDGRDSVLHGTQVKRTRNAFLKMEVRNGKDLTFFISEKGKAFTALNATPVDAAFLPPWDRAVRVGLIAEGVPDQTAVFKKFSLASR